MTPCGDNVILEEMRFENVTYIKLTQDGVHWRRFIVTCFP